MEKERDISKLSRGAFNLLSVQGHLRWEGKKLKFGLIKKLQFKTKANQSQLKSCSARSHLHISWM